MEDILKNNCNKYKTMHLYALLFFILTVSIRCFITVFLSESKELIYFQNNLNISLNIVFVISMLVNIFNLLIVVNLTYLFLNVINILFERIDFKSFEVKKLIYLCYTLPFILNNLLLSLINLNKIMSETLINFNSIIVYLLVSISIYFVLKEILQSKVIHKIGPIVVFFINNIFIIIYFIKEVWISWVKH